MEECGEGAAWPRLKEAAHPLNDPLLQGSSFFGYAAASLENVLLTTLYSLAKDGSLQLDVLDAWLSLRDSSLRPFWFNIRRPLLMAFF